MMQLVFAPDRRIRCSYLAGCYRFRCVRHVFACPSHSQHFRYFAEANVPRHSKTSHYSKQKTCCRYTCRSHLLRNALPRRRIFLGFLEVVMAVSRPQGVLVALRTPLLHQLPHSLSVTFSYEVRVGCAFVWRVKVGLYNRLPGNTHTNNSQAHRKGDPRSFFRPPKHTTYRQTPHKQFTTHTERRPAVMFSDLSNIKHIYKPTQTIRKHTYT